MLTDGYATVFLATAVTLVVASVVAATKLDRKRAVVDEPGRVAVHVG